jgi:tryptophan synthase alpha chain
MKSLKTVLQEKENILSVYFTAGYPELSDTERIIRELEKAGADIIEIGIPYSDPLADGETIQKSSSIALKNGMNLDIAFRQIGNLKFKSEIPLIIMGYFNQMLVFGIEKFLLKCREAGVQALIIPDLPLEEYEEQYKDLFKSYNLTNIFLITPQTSTERIKKIDEMSDTFIYMVSSSNITGAKHEIDEEQKKYFERINNLNLKNPTLIGFGISDKHTFNIACSYSKGAIIGSAFINAISEKGDLTKQIREFIGSLKK